jgi:hypothetical protein
MLGRLLNSWIESSTFTFKSTVAWLKLYLGYVTPTTSPITNLGEEVLSNK